VPDNTFVVGGFRFSTEKEYKDAKKEAEAIEYIRANTDFNDSKATTKLYYKLLDKETFQTIIGYLFLYELQRRIIDLGEVQMGDIKKIDMPKNTAYLESFNDLSKEQKTIKKYSEQIDILKGKLKNTRLINICFVIIIIIMFVLSYKWNYGIYPDFEKKVTNKYAAWQEALDQKAKELTEKEEALLEKEQTLIEKEEELNKNE
jgi:hypothetical protein